MRKVLPPWLRIVIVLVVGALIPFIAPGGDTEEVARRDGQRVAASRTPSSNEFEGEEASLIASQGENNDTIDSTVTLSEEAPGEIIDPQPPQQSTPRRDRSHDTNDRAQELSRVFTTWNRSSTAYSWCHEKEEHNSGLIFVKVPKCASSTGMGVTLRIADTLGRRMLGSNDQTAASCFTRYRHGQASLKDQDYKTRNAPRSAMWSLLRNPMARATSAYFFYEASRLHKNATEEDILEYMADAKFKDFFVNYLKLEGSPTPGEEIQQIMQSYDFLGISERMDESLVVLSMLLQVPLTDVIVMNSKQAGGYDDGRSKQGCVKIKRKWTTPKIDAFLRDEFLKDNHDYLLYQAINASLDRTIHALGANKVEAGVARFRALMDQNDKACHDRAIFPCPVTYPNQTMLSQQDCYFSDAGCGHTCSDEALRVESDEEWNRLSTIKGALSSDVLVSQEQNQQEQPPHIAATEGSLGKNESTAAPNAEQLPPKRDRSQDTSDRAQQLSRVFTTWNRSSTAYSWCHAEEEHNSGLIFIKVPKCASSTGMGVTLRIADTLGRRLNNQTACFTRYRHGRASLRDQNYKNRNVPRSAMWSLLRHPAGRVTSAYFFYEASRLHKNVTEEAMLAYMSDAKFKTFFVNYLRLTKSLTPDEEIPRILQSYDFLGVSERMDESLVVLSMLLQVPLADVIVMSSKQAGGYDDGRSKQGCVMIQRKWTNPKIDAFLRDEFLKDNHDYLLYQAINASLDRTIHALGTEKVAARVARFHALMDQNDKACRDRAIFPCPLAHPKQTELSQHDCYFSDAGCGHKCTDEALRVESDEEWSHYSS